MPSVHVATIEWVRDGADFADSAYARRHHWTFDGGAVIAASSSPHIVPVPMSDASAVDPEEAFVAALSSCHMLWFLDLARRGGFTVDRYADAATGTMGRTDEGAFWVEGRSASGDGLGGRWPGRGGIARVARRGACGLLHRQLRPVRGRRAPGLMQEPD
mgnify:CR=1 FL=1